MENGRHKKLWIVVLVVFLVIVLLAAGCLFLFSFQKHQEDKQKDITPNMITTQIIQEMNYQDITHVQAEQLSKHYNIPEGTISDFSVCMSKSANSGFEISCFELTDIGEFDALQKAIADHVASRSMGFKEANPAEYKNITQSSVEQKGKFVLLVICDDPQHAIKIFRSIV